MSCVAQKGADVTYIQKKDRQIDVALALLYEVQGAYVLFFCYVVAMLGSVYFAVCVVSWVRVKQTFFCVHAQNNKK